MYRNIGIGSELLKKCEDSILDNGFSTFELGVGFNYLMPRVLTSEKHAESVNENLDTKIITIASSFFKKRGYTHLWGKCNCFDMKMDLSHLKESERKVGDIINDIQYRWATIDDIENIIKCS